MGEGENFNETCLIATGNQKYTVIEVHGEGEIKEIQKSKVNITDDLVPVGSFKIHVESARQFKVGDRVIIFRPATDKWIHDLKMDQIDKRKGTKQWTPKEYNLSYEREIIKIEGDVITIDNPIVMQISKKYGGGEVLKYEFKKRISEIGIMNLMIKSDFKDYEDINHGWIGIDFDCAENCWVKDVTTYYLGYSAVSCEKYAKNISIINCKCFESKSIITGGFRYSFNNWGQQNLFMNCKSSEGRHDYVTGARTCGPNVFYNCTASQTFADIGPHHRWATGTLYDNIITDGEINVQDRGQMGSGHGWAGANQVLWNCRAKTVTVQNPWVSANNYCIAVKALKKDGALKDRPNGIWEGQNEINVFPRSLYIAQLMARHKNMDLRSLIK